MTPIARLRAALHRGSHEDARPRPRRPLFAVGDIHGRADLLDILLDRIAAHCAAARLSEWDLVFLGDYVDRGADSAAVLTRLQDMTAANPGSVTCLRGNHEEMFLDFLAGDGGHAVTFLQNGGIDTLLSFGVDAVEPPDGYADIAALQQEALRRIPPETVDWIASRPLWWQSGDVVAVHAAMDPAKPPEAQDEHTMTWGRGPAFAKPRPDGLWIVHGHTVTRPAGIFGRRIVVDTGAWFTEKLTAAAILPETPIAFIDTGPDRG